MLRVVTYLLCGELSAAALARAVPLMDEAWWVKLCSKERADVPECSTETRADIVKELKRLSGERRAA